MQQKLNGPCSMKRVVCAHVTPSNHTNYDLQQTVVVYTGRWFGTHNTTQTGGDIYRWLDVRGFVFHRTERCAH